MQKNLDDALSSSNLPDTSEYIKNNNLIKDQKLQVVKILSNTDIDTGRLEFAWDLWIALFYSWKLGHLIWLKETSPGNVFVVQIQWVKWKVWYRIVKWFDFVSFYADSVKRVLSNNYQIQSISVQKFFEWVDLKSMDNITKMYQKFAYKLWI